MKDLNAEACILSAMMLGEKSISRAISLIQTEDFYLARHQKLFKIILDMYKKGESIDIVTLAAKGMKTLFINDISDIVLSDANMESHCKIVRDHSVRRKLRIIGDSLVKIKESDNPTEIIGNIQSGLFKALDSKAKAFYTAEESVIATLEYLSNTKTNQQVVRTGITELDRLVFMRRGELTVIGGISSSGKSALAHQIAFYNSIYYNRKVGIINIEMKKEPLMMREKSFISQVPLSKLIRSWELTNTEREKIIEAGDKMSDKPFAIDDNGKQTSVTIKAKLQEMKHNLGGLDLVIIDYLQLIRGSNKLSKRELVSQNVEDLKEIAKDLDTHIIAISSMKRKHDSVKDHKPTLHDFKESGDIEYTADICIGLWLDYKHEDVERGMATYRILKQRNGVTGERQFTFIPDTVHFTD